MLRGIAVLLLFSLAYVQVESQPNGIYYPPGPCYVDPCRKAKCPAQRGAICRSTYGGCVAHFYDKYGNDVTKNCQCPPNVRSRRCKPDPCDKATCSTKGECRTDTCGGCDPVFYNRKAKPIIGCPERQGNGICPKPQGLGTCVEMCGKKCPGNQLCCSNGCGHVCTDPYYPDCPGGKQIYCLVNACQYPNCPSNQNAKCKTTCNGCVAHYYDEFNNEIDCDCPSGSFVAKSCRKNLCKNQVCRAYPTAECRISRCGGCHTEFYNKKGRQVNCRKSDCPGGIELHCAVNACQYPNCPRYQNARCKTTCNGCIPHYYDKFGNEIDCDCPADQLIATSCRKNLCKDKVCHAHPNAECRISRCGGCHTEFYQNGVQVQCGRPPLDVACPPPDPKIIAKLPVMLCPAPSCYSNADCKGNDLCCSDGCNQRCISPPFVDPRCPSTDGMVGPCISLCRSNLDCTDRDQICCSNGCGTVCKNKPLDDRCPPPDPKILEQLPYMLCLAGPCKSNSDCTGKKICCSNGCTTQCIYPPGYDDRCPLPIAPVSNIPCRPKICSTNSDCRSDYMCCGLYCGSHCTRKPRTCEPGEFIAKCKNLCASSICRKHPGASCRMHGCNGCKVEFYDSFTNRIYKDCDDVDLPPFA